jgi:hypothetical protein
MSAKYNITCEQGATFTFQFTVKTGDTPWNLTGYSATMTIRPFVGSPVTAVSATTVNGKIVIVGATGQVTVTLDDTTTADLVASRYAYDLILDSGSVVTRLLEGKFVVTPSVTQ